MIIRRSDKMIFILLLPIVTIRTRGWNSMIIQLFPADISCDSPFGYWSSLLLLATSPPSKLQRAEVERSPDIYLCDKEEKMLYHWSGNEASSAIVSLVQWTSICSELLDWKTSRWVLFSQRCARMRVAASAQQDVVNWKKGARKVFFLGFPFSTPHHWRLSPEFRDGFFTFWAQPAFGVELWVLQLRDVSPCIQRIAGSSWAS